MALLERHEPMMVKGSGGNSTSFVRGGVPHNHKLYKHALGHSHAWVNRTCVTCGVSFDTQVKTVARGGGLFCCKSCNPAFKARFTKSEKARRYNLKSNYDVTTEWFAEETRKRDGKCDVCGGVDYGKHGKLYVDHDHKSGKVRGLLCNHCNWGLGHFKDETQLLAAAIAYLEKHEGRA